ncbi:hypothetical protein MVEG_08223 [Podila verticillata NRRL 6337]|nr:hypothetical protein MVEG_08223 [Podila verticillata NRRL 6337]
MTVPEILSQYSIDAAQEPLPDHNLYKSTAQSMLPLTPEEYEYMSKPKVLISGAGLGGLTLALLLHKANVPFLVFERAKDIKPLGSALLLGSTIAPLMKQLGLYDDLVNIGKHSNISRMYDEHLNPLFTMDFSDLSKIGDGHEFIVARPDIYDLLWRNVPRENILLGKRVLSFNENGHGVEIRCSDNSAYTGDILVGADGAYSAVRQHLYKILKKSKRLPISDDAALPFSCVCLVGQTDVLDPEEFPNVKPELCQHNSVLGFDNQCSWLTFTTKQNTVCWMVIQFLNRDTWKQNDSFRNSEWGPEAAEAMCREIRGFKVPGGTNGRVLTLGDYLDKTPKELISKVMLEEKVFETWYGGRTVLLGDACHKMNPSGAAGALTAMHDAVTLANWIHTLRLPEVSDLETVFKEYQTERYPVAKAAFESSQLFTRLWGKNMAALVSRAMMKRIPGFLWRKILSKLASSRPQVSFLPLVENNGTGKIAHQPSLYKTLEILEKQAQAKKMGTASAKLVATV